MGLTDGDLILEAEEVRVAAKTVAVEVVVETDDQGKDLLDT